MMAQFPSKEIAELSNEFRTLGLGYANIGGLLMQQGHGYDSDEGRAICATITALMTGESYNISSKLAKELGPFKKFKDNENDMLRVISNHRMAAHGEEKNYKNIAKNIVQLHKGTIAASNRINTKGAQVEVLLPKLS